MKVEAAVKKEIGARIKQIRMVANMSQANLADYIGGVAASTISAYEKGVITPQHPALLKLASLANVSYEDLAYGGEIFNSSVGTKASDIQRCRERVRGPSGAYTPKIGGKTSIENRLVTVFRLIPEEKQRKMVEDAEQWVLRRLTKADLNITGGSL